MVPSEPIIVADSLEAEYSDDGAEVATPSPKAPRIRSPSPCHYSPEDVQAPMTPK